MIFVRQIKKRPADPAAKATEFGGRRCPKARDQGVTFAAMLAGPSLIRRANLCKGHAMRQILRSRRDGGYFAVSARRRAHRVTAHFDAARHNSGAVQHFIRAARVCDLCRRVGSRNLAWILPLIECAATMSAHGIGRTEGFKARTARYSNKVRTTASPRSR
jgi:hypothetical protein